MANYWVTTITLAPPVPDQARWQVVCENGKPLVFDPSIDYTTTPDEFWPAYIGLGLIHESGDACVGRECDPMLDRLAPDNIAAELADIVRAIR